VEGIRKNMTERQVFRAADGIIVLYNQAHDHCGKEKGKIRIREMFM